MTIQHYSISTLLFLAEKYFFKLSVLSSFFSSTLKASNPITQSNMSATTHVPVASPIQIRVPPELVCLRVNVKNFLEANSHLGVIYDRLVVSACIFAPRNSDDPELRLLIVQRAADETGFPNKWEIPGGSCERNDPSVAHSLGREVFEETSLRLTRFCRKVGESDRWMDGRDNTKWLKLTFEIEVEEVHGLGGQYTKEGYEHVTIKLDPKEHQRYAWATEDEIKQSHPTSGPYPTATESQGEKMLEAFALHREDRNPVPRTPQKDEPHGGKGWPEVREGTL